MMPTILILTSKTGGGHISLAEALRDRLQDQATIKIIDPQARFVHWHYRLVSRYALWLWSTEFRSLNTPARALCAHRIFTPLVARALKTIIARVQPDMIITTYPFLTYEVMQLLEKHHASIPFIMLFTDPSNIHASWLSEKRASATLAPTRETYQQALNAGFAPERLHQVGWPVRAQFSRVETARSHETLSNLGLIPGHFTLFLQGGGEGSAQFGRTVESILAIDPDLQIILATGTNRALYARFQNVKHVTPLPFTKDIATYMAAADVIMGKAGPNMLFEALTLGKPFIATTYIPGQEEANLEFIRQHQLGWIALSAEEQLLLLQRIISQRAELHTMEANVRAYQAENTAQTELIVPVLEDLLAVKALAKSHTNASTSPTRDS
jgi:UDP-N-acetylglucosamine:LPS N-acetylglucosamine transferase